SRTGDGLACFGRHPHALRMQAICENFFLPQVLERSCTDVERYEGMMHASIECLLQQCLVEVKSGSGRRDGATFARVHRLVTFTIEKFRGSLEVRRQWDLTDRVKHFRDGLRKLQAKELAIPACHFDFDVVLQVDARPRARPLACTDFRGSFAWRENPFEQYLDPAPARLLPAESRLHYARIVEHQQVT